MKLSRVAVLVAASLSAAPPGVLERITEDDLRANLSFLASDVLEGRSTPSQGQAIAAEFIASRFRLAHLTPIANGGYCQQAEFGQWTPVTGKVMLTSGSRKLKVTADEFSLRTSEAVNLDRVPVVRIQDVVSDAVLAKAAETAFAIDPGLASEQRAKLLEAHPALVVTVWPGERTAARAAAVGDLEDLRQPRLSLWGEAGKFVTGANATVSVRVPAAPVARLRACNIAGVLTGSDPALQHEYVVVSAHYDHLAPAASGTDRIFNGANDDASGTVSVIEIAQALAAMPVKPRRSILFIAFSGEELGLLGSRYYAKHPLVPLAQTVGQINLEQLGRTDDKEGFGAGSMTFTGFEFTDLPHEFEKNAAGVRVYATDDSNEYFGRSDNQALADAGIPATTVSAAFRFADYHQVSDEWQKIDFANMTKVDRAIAEGIIAIADRAEPPHWNGGENRTKRYRQAHKRLHPEAAS